MDKNLTNAKCSLWVWHTWDHETCQWHQTWYESVDSKQVYSDGKLIRPRLNGVKETTMLKLPPSNNATVEIVGYSYLFCTCNCNICPSCLPICALSDSRTVLNLPSPLPYSPDADGYIDSAFSCESFFFFIVLSTAHSYYRTMTVIDF